MYRLSSNDYQKLAEKFDSFGDYKIADYYDKQLRFAQELSPEIEKALERQDAAKKTTRQKVFDAGFGALEAHSALTAKSGMKHAYDLAMKAKDPTAAKKAGFLANLIATKIPKLAFIAKSLPFLGVIIHIAFSYPVVMDYINKIQQGKFEKEIWADPTERATFIEQCVMLIAGFMMAPPLNAIPGFAAAGSAMYAFSSAISLGKKGIEYGLRASGDIDENKEEIAAQAGLSLKTVNLSSLLQVYDPQVKNILNTVVLPYLKSNPNAKLIDVLNSPQIANLDFMKNPSLNTKNNLLAHQLREGTTLISKKLKENIKESSPSAKSLNPAQPNNFYIGYGYNAFKRTNDQQRALEAMLIRMKQDDISEENKTLIKKGFFDMFKSYKPLR